jgi:hypothetical protein
MTEAKILEDRYMPVTIKTALFLVRKLEIKQEE